jgi:tetratricopeptide (TPR) repeat protein
MGFKKNWFLGIFIVVFFTLSWKALGQALRYNILAQQTLRAILLQSERLLETRDALARAADQDCRINWLQGHVEQQLGDLSRRDAAWQAALACDVRYVSLLALRFPQEREWAELAVTQWPAQADAWFWLARTYLQGQGSRLELINDADRADVIGLYRKGLDFAPANGLRWCQLGHFLEPVDPQGGMDAYLQCCSHGDPGSNGCWGAGRIAEQRGDLQQAIENYRLSHWPVARQRADELERQQMATPQP